MAGWLLVPQRSRSGWEDHGDGDVQAFADWTAKARFVAADLTDPAQVD